MQTRPRVSVNPTGAVNRNTLRVLRDDGSLDEKLDPSVTPELLIKMYRAMVRIRLIDERLEKLQRQGRIAFHVGSLGEEAAVIGAAAALEPTDWIVPCYREVGALLWRGYSLQTYLDHMYGNAADPVRGRQMPDHVVSREHRYLSVSAPIGTQMPHAVGIAWAEKMRGSDAIAGVFFGDGASSSNDFHAAMNFAAVFKVPVVFLCRNNGWAISLPTEKQSATATIAEKAAAYNMRAQRVDGNDVFAVYRAVSEARTHARSGAGPMLVELVTYRMGGHSTSDDPRVYRSDEELEKARKRDPIRRLREHLEQHQLWTEAQEKELHDGVLSELRDAIEGAENKSKPELRTMFEEVYEEMPPHLRAEYEDCARTAQKKSLGDDDE